MATTTIVNRRGEVVIPDPPWAHALFDTTRFAWLWLIVRLYVGYAWLWSGWGKFNNPAWWSGEALKGFWTSATAIPATGAPKITYGWYRDFLDFMLEQGWYTWFGPLIMFGELAVGIGLVLGLLTGIAAFFGALMNINFMLAGTASTNPVLFTLAILLMGAWKVAGWFGLDRWLLPLLGTPWMRPDEFPKQPDAPPTPTEGAEPRPIAT
jgi:thiosulfate dehydrogenase [quinone] large subunit